MLVCEHKDKLRREGTKIMGVIMMVLLFDEKSKVGEHVLKVDHVMDAYKALVEIVEWSVFSL